MSLRTKFLVLFAGFGVVPIVALGVYGYFRSVQSVEQLIRERTSAIAEDIAGEIQSRDALRKSDLLLFADNAETRRLYEAYLSGDSAAYASALNVADTYLREAWAVLGSSYTAIVFRDIEGKQLYGLGDGPAAGVDGTTLGLIDRGGLFSLIQPIRAARSESEIGTMDVTVRLQSLLPRELLAASFGERGYTVVLDRANSEVLHHPSATFMRQPVSNLLGPAGWDLAPDFLAEERGSFAFDDSGDRRIASFVTLSSPEWTVVISGSVSEFAAPFARFRALDLSLVLAVAATIGLGFLLVVLRMTRSLTALTFAADQVARGNLVPELPAAGSDEVGRLAGAFRLMLERVREMLKRVRESRHMAAVGKFASQLSHEIRNPLTSVKLNLQRLERGVEAGHIDRKYAESIAISLDEVQRLEGVAQGVLRLARTAPPHRRDCSVHASLEGALRVLGSQLDAQHIALETEMSAIDDVVVGDGEQLKGMFLNLLLNSVEAMPEGGRLRVRTEDEAESPDSCVIRVRIADDGPGVPSDIREKIFEPFFTNKPGGTGFGLALAQRAVEEHAGRLTLEDDDTAGGATFVVELPLAAATLPAKGGLADSKTGDS